MLIRLFLLLITTVLFTTNTSSAPSKDLITLNDKLFNSDYSLPSQRIELGNKALKLARDQNEKIEEAKALFNIGLGYQELGDYDLSMDKLVKSLTIFRNHNAYDWIAMTLDNIGYNYWSFGNYTNAQNYFEESLEASRQSNQKNRIAASLVNLALSLGSQKKYQKSLQTYQEAREVYKTMKDSAGLGALYSNMGTLYQDQKNIGQAIFYFDLARKIAYQYDRKRLLAEIYDNLGSIFMQKNDLAKSIELLKKAEKLIKVVNNKFLLLENYKLQSRYYEKANKYIKALEYQKKYILHYERIMNNKKINRISELQSTLEVERNEINLNLKELELKALKKQKTAQLIAFALFTILVLYIIFTMRASFIRKNKEMEHHQKKLQIEHQTTQTILEYKSKELTNFALFITQRNDFLADIKQKLNNIKKQNEEEILKGIGQLTREITHKIKANSDLKEFNTSLENVSSEFFTNLKDKFPQLTENELKLAALIRLELSSKEIGYLKNTSPKSVDMSRYRLRKKLNLGKNENFLLFLQSF